MPNGKFNKIKLYCMSKQQRKEVQRVNKDHIPKETLSSYFQITLGSEIPGKSRYSKSCDACSAHTDSKTALHALSSFVHENIHALRVVTLSADEIVTISKTNLREIIL